MRGVDLNHRPLGYELDAWPFASFGVHEDHWRTEKVAAISLTSSNVLGTGFPTGGKPYLRGLSRRLLICEIEPHFSFLFEPASSP